MNKRLIASLAGALLAAGCGGGGGSSVTPATHIAPAKTQPGTATVSLTIPASASHSFLKSPKYVSSATESVTIAQGTTALGTFNTASSSAGCAAAQGGLQCSFSIAPTVGTNEVFTVTAYQYQNATGAVLSSGQTTATIAANVATTIPVTMNGQVASLSVVVPTQPPAGTAASEPVVVMAKDAGGSTIVGPGIYTAPVTVTAPSGGIVKLAVDGGTPSASVVISGPADTLSASYSGANVSFAALSATTTPLGQAQLTGVGYLAPIPTVVSVHSGTSPSNYIYATSVSADSVTHSFWQVQYNTTSGQYFLAQITPSGAVNSIDSGLASFCCAVLANGPGGKLLVGLSGTPPTFASVDPVTGAMTTVSINAPQYSSCYFNALSDSATSIAPLVASAYCYSTSSYHLLALDTTGNVLGDLPSDSNAGGFGIGSTYYYSYNQNALASIDATGTSPSLTLTAGPYLTATQPTFNGPVAASDGSIWDSVNCTITHTVPGSPLSSSTISYYPLPASLCPTSFSNALLGNPVVLPDGSVWSLGYNGLIVGVLSSSPAASAPSSGALIPVVTSGSTQIPFSPQTLLLAPDGNLEAFGSFNNVTDYTVEIAY